MIEKLLKYQEIDGKLREIEVAISGSNETVRLAIGICTSRPVNYQSETLHNRPATTWKTITTSGYETIEIQDISKPQAEKILEPEKRKRANLQQFLVWLPQSFAAA